MKVLLVYTCSPPESLDPFGSRLPIGLGYLAAALFDHGHECQIVNLARKKAKYLKKKVEKWQPHYVGFTMFTFNRQAVLQAASDIKKWSPKTKTILGGPHATALGLSLKDRHSFIDHVVEKEGEEELLKLLKDKGQNEMWQNLQPGKAMQRAGVKDPEDYIYLSTSRGCKGHCTFCSSPSFWPKGVRFHSIDWIMNELRFRHNEMGLDFISFRDDSFTTNKERLINLCKAIEQAKDLQLLWDCQARAQEIDGEIARALLHAGCRTVQLGIEHGSLKMRRLLGKSDDVSHAIRATKELRQVGIFVSWFLITAIPGESEQDRQATKKLIKEGRPHDVVLSPLALYPGTTLYRREARRRTLPNDFWLTAQEHWTLALPYDEGQKIMKKEAPFLSSCAAKHQFTTKELTKVWLAHGKPWPLTYSLALHLLAEGKVKRAKKILLESENKKRQLWITRLLAELRSGGCS